MTNGGSAIVRASSFMLRAGFSPLTFTTAAQLGGTTLRSSTNDVFDRL
jgi:hypothetical protein